MSAQSEKPAKPTYGSPVCNGCGVCCKHCLCPLAGMHFGKIVGPCPALEDVGDRYNCGLVEHPEKYAPLAAAAAGAPVLSAAARLCIGVGVGCDSLASGEADNLAFALKMRTTSDGQQRKIAEALAAWFGRRASILHFKYALMMDEFERRFGDTL